MRTQLVAAPAAVAPIRRSVEVGPVHRLVLHRRADSSLAIGFGKEEGGQYFEVEPDVRIEPKDLDYLLQGEGGAIAFGAVTIRLRRGLAAAIWGNELVGTVPHAELASGVRAFLAGQGDQARHPKRSAGDRAWAAARRRSFFQPRPTESKVDWANLGNAE